MKRILSAIMALIMAFSLQAGVYAAKPSGGGSTDNITFSPAAPVITAGDSVTVTASWTSTQGMNRTEWYLGSSSTPLDGSTQAFTSDKKAGTSSYTFTSSTEGTYELRFRIYNTAYTSRDKSKTININVNASSVADTTPPVSNLSLNGTAGSGGWYTSDVAAALSSSDTGGSGLKEILYKLDDGAQAVYQSPLTISKEGATKIEYWSVDKAGNSEIHKIKTINIDKTAPEASYSMNPSGQTSGTVEITINAALDQTSGVESITNPDAKVVLGSISNYTVSSNGNYAFVVRDKAGNSFNLNVGVSNIAQTQTEIRYVSLGDSIATGTTSPLTNNTVPYTDQFQTYLEDNNPGVNVIRSEFEANGDRTNELYDKLGLGDVSSTAVMDQNLIDAVRNADVITVCIGGNNLMQACATGLWYKPYDFFKPNVSLASKGYNDFMSQYDDIMKRIDELDKDSAVVIVMTQYNPYNIADTYMHNLVDGYYIGSESSSTDGMNDIINGLSGTYNYRVADVFAEFDKYNANMSAVTLLYPSSFTRNPHPNQYGQNLITDLHTSEYELLN